ncbi:MAG TPA: hypothetical protein VMR77_02925 [Patescibacteria group bacterium]|jgi:hypothetical protein|nr:hypothetical protein [Patescibacteria group bacterium]
MGLITLPDGRIVPEGGMHRRMPDAGLGLEGERKTSVGQPSVEISIERMVGDTLRRTESPRGGGLERRGQ